MAVITIGAGAADYDYTAGIGYTWVDKNNPCNGNGSLSSMSFYCDTSIDSMKCGTFYGTSSLTKRDYENIGSISSGSKQTFSGLSCDVQVGDFLGIYFASGEIDYSLGGSGVLFYVGDGFVGTNNYYLTDGKIAMEGTGTGTIPASGVEYNGITISEFNGVAIASINIP